MSCFNDIESNKKVIIEGERKCQIDKDLASCPNGYSRIDLKQVPYDYIDFCAGEFPILKNGKWVAANPHIGRFVAMCQRDKTAEDYPGDKLKCCLGEEDPKKCPPGFCKDSNNCKSHLNNLCTDPKNINEPYCAVYCDKNKEECSRARFRYCVDNNLIDTAQCRNYANDTTISVNWDTEWIKYCNKPENSSKVSCACFGNDPKWAGNPSCFNPDCIINGYKTNGMKSKNCPSICQSIVSANSTTGNINFANIVQQCDTTYGVKENNNTKENNTKENRENNTKENNNIGNNTKENNTKENNNIGNTKENNNIEENNIEENNIEENNIEENNTNSFNFFILLIIILCICISLILGVGIIYLFITKQNS